MAIKTDDSSISVNFVYHDDELDEDFVIKLHGIDGIGRAVSVHGPIRSITDNGVEYLSFPAQLLVETVDFLRSQGYLKLSGVASTGASPLHGTQISQNRSTGVLPMPNFSGQSASTVVPIQAGAKKEKPYLPPGPPLQSLSSAPMSNESSIVVDDGEYITEEDYEDDEDIDMEPVGDGQAAEFQKLADARAAAAEKASVAGSEVKVARPVRVDYGQQVKQKIEQQAEEDYEDYEEV